MTTTRTADSAVKSSRWAFLTDGPPIRKPVFYSAVIGVLVMATWAIFAPDQAERVIGEAVARVVDWFGWFYVLLTTAVLVFVLYLAISRYGSIKLGPDHSKPQFSTFAWASMLFAAGIGTDVMFYAVAEPVSQYMVPPTGDPETIAAAREATVWTLFHYGISGWGLYALMGMALGYFTYRMNLPLAVRSALYPIFGRRVDGGLGHAVDTAAVLGTIFGVATSLGIGVVFLNQGLNILFDVPVGLGAQIGLVVLAVAMAAISATTGVDKGIRFLSQLNVILALGLAAFVLLTGRTSFILNAVVMNVGDYAQTFPRKTMETFAFEGATEWMSLWTLFFWAWWIAWASFVGLFLARISRGRTIRQFVAGTMIIPFTYIVMWISIFGNAALDRIRGGDDAFADAALASPEAGFYSLLEDYPLSGVVIAVSVFVGLLFYVTSADSGALVMGNLSSELRSVQDDAAPWLRIVWASATGLLTIAVLAVGGIYALQYATVIFGLPFAFVIVLVMLGLLKALRVEGRRAGAVTRALPMIVLAATRTPTEKGTPSRRGRPALPVRSTSSTSRQRRPTSTPWCDPRSPRSPTSWRPWGADPGHSGCRWRRGRRGRRVGLGGAAHPGRRRPFRLPSAGPRVTGADVRRPDDRRPRPLRPPGGAHRRWWPGLRRDGLLHHAGHP